MKKRDKYFRNGLLNENKVHFIRKIAEIIKNNKGQNFKLSHDEIIEVYEQAIELKKINESVRNTNRVKL